MRGWALWAMTAMLAAVLVAGLAWAEEYETPSGPAQDQIELNNTEMFPNPKRGPVPFSHRAHHEDYKVKCTQCHHDPADGENLWKEGDDVVRCSECHSEPYLSVGGMPSLYQAYHRNCIGCHKQTDSAPRQCSECHQ